MTCERPGDKVSGTLWLRRPQGGSGAPGGPPMSMAEASPPPFATGYGTEQRIAALSVTGYPIRYVTMMRNMVRSCH